MTMVGFLWMKAASRPEANSMAMTATITATTMIGS